MYVTGKEEELAAMKRKKRVKKVKMNKSIREKENEVT
jgi:hypothetical protein